MCLFVEIKIACCLHSVRKGLPSISSMKQLPDCFFLPIGTSALWDSAALEPSGQHPPRGGAAPGHRAAIARTRWVLEPHWIRLIEVNQTGIQGAGIQLCIFTFWPHSAHQPSEDISFLSWPSVCVLLQPCSLGSFWLIWTPLNKWFQIPWRTTLLCWHRWDWVLSLTHKLEEKQRASDIICPSYVHVGDSICRGKSEGVDGGLYLTLSWKKRRGHWPMLEGLKYAPSQISTVSLMERLIGQNCFAGSGPLAEDCGPIRQQF